VSIFANLPISRKLMAAFAAVIVVIFASSALVYDRLLVIEIILRFACAYGCARRIPRTSAILTRSAKDLAPIFFIVWPR
jgi:hypothetical protein